MGAAGGLLPPAVISKINNLALVSYVGFNS